MKRPNLGKDNNRPFFMKISRLLSIALSSTPLFMFQGQAMESQPVTGPWGNQIVLRFFPKGEDYTQGLPNDDDDNDDDESTISTHNLDGRQKETLLKAANYWVNVIRPVSGSQPVVFNVGTMDDYNADAYSPDFEEAEEGRYTYVGAVMHGIEVDSDIHGQIRIGHGIVQEGWGEDLPGMLPLQKTGSDLFATMVHEIGHALGISANISSSSYSFLNNNEWTTHLYSSEGVQAGKGITIGFIDRQGNEHQGDFYVNNENATAYFKGKHVDEVLDGALIATVDTEERLPGIPVNCRIEQDTPELSHIELRNCLMSHQSYSNYRTFTEAELAIMQDLGYDIDRRNFFGYSVYGDNLSMTNNHVYYARNGEGSAYLTGVANTADFGIGLHVYGSHNAIYQKSELLACGNSAAGIRVDGESNFIVIGKESRILANGSNGTGIAFCYGKNHDLLVQGNVMANGDSGVALRFDFGKANNGPEMADHGSFFYFEYNAPEGYLPDILNGSMMDHVDIAGSIAGKQAAIFISDNALVDTINIMTGASISGDIISEWNPWKQDLPQQGLYTELNFGVIRNADEDYLPDPSFSLSYEGSITGPLGIEMNVSGGHLHYTGTANVLRTMIGEQAILSGSSSITTPDFINAGTIIPGTGKANGKMTVSSAAVMESTSRIVIGIAPDGTSDQFIVNGSLEADGTLDFMPVQGYYRTGIQLSERGIFGEQMHKEGDWSQLELTLFSPTLGMNVKETADGTYSIDVQRPDNAYSRYARSGNAAHVGKAIDSISSHAASGMQDIIASFDFSSADGTGIGNALSQMTAASYDNAVQSTLDTEQLFNAMLLHRLQTGTNGQMGRLLFGALYGSTSDQNARDNTLGYTSTGGGFLGGLEYISESSSSIGLDIAYNGRKVRTTTNALAKTETDGFYLGFHGRFSPKEWKGLHLFGAVRGGLEHSDNKRHMSFDGFQGYARSRWDSFTSGAILGAGKDWKTGSFTITPFAAVDHALMQRPSITEQGADALNLHLPSRTFQSVRCVLGTRLLQEGTVYGSRPYSVDISIQWNHETMGNNRRFRTSFNGYGADAFTTCAGVTGRDSMGLQVGGSIGLTQSVSLGCRLGSEFFRPGYSTLNGNLSVNWTF